MLLDGQLAADELELLSVLLEEVDSPEEDEDPPPLQEIKRRLK